MPTITLSKKEVLKLVGRAIPDAVLKEKIPLLGTDLEAVEEKEIHVEIFPNRPDMLTEEGFARALSSFLGIKTGVRTYKVHPSRYRFAVDKKVKTVRPAVAAAAIRGIALHDDAIVSIMDMQDKLALTHGRNRRKVAVGVHDLDKMTFPLVYTTKPRSFRFIPLDTSHEHSLDEILESHPKGKEFGHLLSNHKEFPVWIDAKGRVLSMPPVINAEDTKLTPSTRNLFLDITGTDQQAVELALNIIVAGLADRGGKIFRVNNFPDAGPRKIAFSLSYAQKLLGIPLSRQQAKKFLERMGMTLKGNSVLYPFYRADILHPRDVIEDIAIAYGYDKFAPEIPRVATMAEEDAFEKFKNKVADILIGLSMQEVSTYHITSKDIQTVMMKAGMETISILNPKSAEYNSLRAWMIPSLLEVLKNNKQHEYPQRIFEIGTVFKKSGEEVTRLAVALAGADANFTQVRQVLDALAAAVNLRIAYKETEHPSFIPGRVARVSCSKKDVAYIGELHPHVLQNFGLEMPVAVCEINLTELSKEK